MSCVPSPALQVFMQELQGYLLTVVEMEGVLWFCSVAFYLKYVGRWHTGAREHVEDSKQKEAGRAVPMSLTELLVKLY